MTARTYAAAGAVPAVVALGAIAVGQPTIAAAGLFGAIALHVKAALTSANTPKEQP